MRITIIARLIAILLLLGGALAIAIPATSLTAITAAQGKSDDKKDGNARDNADKKDKKDKDKKPKGDAVIDSSPYRVEVACDYDDDAGTSLCTFTGIVPDGGKKINHLDVPQDTVCTDVVGGEYKAIEDDPHTGVTGYQTKGSADTVTLLLDGQVTPARTATYWLKAADAILPASGPGLECAQATTFELETTSESAEPTAEPTATPIPTTGELEVFIYTCADVPSDTTDFDWFRFCDSEGGVHALSLEKVSETALQPIMMETDASGDAAFTGLEPGLYSLEMPDATWCKAMSDNVDAEGNVIIEAGARTTVYGFVCEPPPAT